MLQSSGFLAVSGGVPTWAPRPTRQRSPMMAYCTTAPSSMTAPGMTTE